MNKELEDKIKAEVPQDDSTSREEKEILMQSIKDKKPKHLIETGTHRGLTTLYLLTAIDKGHLNTADPYEWGAAGNFRKFPELEKMVTYFQQRGSEMIRGCDNKSIEWAFIDGYHEKVEVIEEVEVLLPKLADGAVVWFHDTNGSNPSCDVPGAIEELGLKVEYLKTQNGMAKYVHKKNSVGVVAKVD